MDPDEFIRAHGPQAFAEVLERAVSLPDMVLIRAARDRDMSRPEHRAAFEAEVLAYADSIKDPLVRKNFRIYFEDRIARLFGRPPATAPVKPPGPLLPLADRRTMLKGAAQRMLAESRQMRRARERRR